MAVTITAVRRLFNDTCSLTDQGITEDRNYLVTVAEATATPWDLVYAVNEAIPAAFSHHESNSFLIVQKKDAKRAKENTSYNWIIGVEYGPIKPGQNNDSQDSSSDARSISIKISGIEETIPTIQTIQDDGTPGDQAQNSFKDVYPEPVDVTIYSDQIVIDYYTAHPPETDLRSKVNSDEVTLNIPQQKPASDGYTPAVGGPEPFIRTWAAGTLMMKGIDLDVSVPPNNTTGEQAYHVTVTMIYRAEGWKKKLVQKGYHYKKDGKVKESTTPVFLDSEGQRLAEGAKLVLTAPFQFYATGAFLPFLQAVNSA